MESMRGCTARRGRDSTGILGISAPAVTSSGTGETNAYGSQMAYVPSCNCLVTYGNAGGGSGTAPSIWVGSLTGGSGGGGQTSVNSLVVKVTDANGNPVAGVPVTFTVTAGVATLTGGVTQLVVNTDSQGLASTTVTLGANSGVTTVTASSGTLAGSPVLFTATGGGTTLSRCDLDGDGTVNVLDVQIAINQSLGVAPCGSADLMGNGTCTVIDVQRIVNASLGGTCQVGQ